MHDECRRGILLHAVEGGVFAAELRPPLWRDSFESVGQGIEFANVRKAGRKRSHCGGRLSLSNSRKSVSGKMHATAATFDDCFSMGSLLFGSPVVPVQPIMRHSCPPDERAGDAEPVGSTLYFFALALMKRTARWMSPTMSGTAKPGWLPCVTMNTT